MAFTNIQVSSINYQPLVAIRYGVDPTSNPDPYTGGLIVNSADTQPYPTIYNVPLTAVSSDGLGLGTNFVYDPSRAFTLNGATITCNRNGFYNISIQLSCLSNLTGAPGDPANFAVGQVVKNGQAVFGGPPGVSAGSAFISIDGSPVAPIYNIAALTSGGAGVALKAGDIISLAFYLAKDTAVIALTSGVSIFSL